MTDVSFTTLFTVRDDTKAYISGVRLIDRPQNMFRYEIQTKAGNTTWETVNNYKCLSSALHCLAEQVYHYDKYGA